MNKHISKSLKLQLFFATVISLLTAFAIFGISFLLGNTLLDQTVYGHAFAKRMEERQFSRLQSYVETEAITLGDLQKLDAWYSQGKKIYLTIYNEDTVIYHSPIASKSKSEANSHTYDRNAEDPDHEYTLTLYDGTTVYSYLYCYAGSAFYFWMLVVSGLLAFLGFSICFVLLISKKISYITLLKQELDILSGGQLDYTVTIKGNDELGELAAGIDQMRCSIVKHQEIEKQMRTSNSQLITAMSHDLRTPLTSLLAYLEIIERKKYTDEEQLHNLVHKSVKQTMRIRNMADKLFEYFLVYATEWEQSERETTDADELFFQILEDYAGSLENNGMNVIRSFSQVSGQINVNTELLQRALDNLYSNLLKYADPEQSIQFTYQRKGKKLLLTISNGIKREQQKNDSTCIGLNTCRRIIEYHNGSFSSSENQKTFTVMIELPLLEKGPSNP